MTWKRPSCATRRSSAARRIRSISPAWSRPTCCAETCREPIELAVELAPGAVNIPLGQLRSRLGELPRDKEIRVICRSGGRAYYATRVLLQNGFQASTLAGGMLSRAQSDSFWAD